MIKKKLSYKEQMELKKEYFQLIDIIMTYGILHDINGNTKGPRFDSKWVTKKWDKIHTANQSIFEKLCKLPTVEY